MAIRGLVAIAMGLVLAAAAGAAELVVDQGNPAAADTNPGTADQPFKTVSKAVSAVQPGDVVLIKAGVYREIVKVAASGTAEKRITVKAAPGQRVLINGADEVKLWRKCTREEGRGNPNWEKFYVVEMAEAPSTLFQDGQYLKKPRWPVDGKLATEGGQANSVVDSKNLTQPAGFWEGGTLIVRVDKIGSYKPGLITAYDPARHELTTDKPRTDPTVAGKDLYWIENVVTIIHQPGEFAVDARTKPAKVYLWPLGDADPSTRRMETPVRGPFLVTWGAGVGFVTFDGLEAAYGEGSAFGGDDKVSKGSHDIEVVNCVGHHMERAGFSSYDLSRMTVRRCVFARNDYGLMFTEGKDCLAEENLARSCRTDGFVVSWNADNVRLIRNASVDNWFSNHPDGFQIYRQVKNLYLEGNLFFNVGQGCMMEEAELGKFVNNMIVGTHHTGVIFGGGNAKVEEQVRKFELNGNTIAFTGFKGLSSNGPDMVLRNNVILGGDRTVTRVSSKSWQADYNLYGQPEGWKLAKAEGQDVHSKIVPQPKFRCAPPEAIAFVIDQWDKTKPLELNTPGKFYLNEPPSQHFKVGDHVEVNFDGLVRKAVEVTDEYIVFDPPLPALHEWRWETIVNWKDRTDFAWDLRLADDSPGKGLGDKGQDVGSTIDIQAYLQGDFNGDGKRELPAVSADVLKP